tara:strand:- start:202 stop:372 length:171 start_codon:yes stop_codon:yes gene_type:complete
MTLNKKDLQLIKKALRICVVKFHHRGQKVNDIDSRILANKFEKVKEKLKYVEIGGK